MPKTLKLRELLKRLADYGVVEHPKPSRGNGSELLVYKPNAPGSLKGPIFPLTNHSKGRDVPEGQLSACLRRFGIDKLDFFDGL